MTLWRFRQHDQGLGAEPAAPCQSCLLTVRTAVIMVTSCAAGIGAGYLTMAVQPHPATAIIAGVAAWAATVRFLDGIIGEV
jgi:hypothetical protein